MSTIFILRKPVGKHPKGKQFDGFGGLVSSVLTTINGQDVVLNFNDKRLFKQKTFLQ